MMSNDRLQIDMQTSTEAGRDIRTNIYEPFLCTIDI
jgi:hypothetical protein